MEPVVSPTVEKVFKMCVPDEHFERIKDMLKDAGRIGVHITHKNGNRVRFYKQNGKVFADERKEDDSIFTQEVIPMSDVPQVKMDHSDFRKEMLTRIENDKPEISQEEKEALADVLYEANEAIKKLIASGVHPGVAKAIIESVLNDKEVIDNTGGSAEALAATLKEREAMFGHPHDKGYGEDEIEAVEKIEAP